MPFGICRLAPKGVAVQLETTDISRVKTASLDVRLDFVHNAARDFAR